MMSHWVILLSVSVITLLNPVSATLQKESSINENQHSLNGNNRETPRVSATEPKPVYPKHLDISSLQNMPLVILHPRRPINFQLLPGESLSSIHESLTPSKLMELVQSATFSTPHRVMPQSSNKEDNRKTGNRYTDNRQPQATANQAVSVESDSHFNDPALPRSLMHPNMNNGWFQRFRGSVSNMLPRFTRPGNGGPFGLPTMNMPSFLPQPSNMHGIISPFAPSPFQQFQSLPWGKFNFLAPGGDLSTGASHRSPLRAMFSNLPMIGFRPPSYGPPIFGGDLATSGSAFIPRHVIPPPHFALPPHPLNRHKPLFNDIGSLQAASMEISNAFADFTDSKEHGPEVTQRFGSVGTSINNFLKMMGLGSDMSFGNVGGFGGGADMAALDSTPIARSMDFYPGYGNQAHFDDFDNLDDIVDFPMFEKDITQEYMKKMNITNETMEEAKKEIEVLEKEVMTTKTKMEPMEKEKMVMIKEVNLENHDDKSKKNGEDDKMYAPAVPLQKMKDEKLPAKKERPIVNYKIPPIHSTVAPHERKQPVAIYQNFNHQDSNAPKAPAYAPAQAMPHPEEEDNPNKLVDDDVVRQWRLVNSGKGYVEKHPVPILDILQAPKQPESLKVAQKVLSDIAKKDSS